MLYNGSKDVVDELWVDIYNERSFISNDEGSECNFMWRCVKKISRSVWCKFVEQTIVVLK